MTADFLAIALLGRQQESVVRETRMLRLTRGARVCLASTLPRTRPFTMGTAGVMCG
jgi:hypothetical protein